MTARAKPAPLTLEETLTSPAAFGLTTASAVQRAFCRVADGLPLGALAEDPVVLAALKGTTPAARPTELYFASGSRVGKSVIAAALAFRASQTVDVSALGPGDEPRIPVLSLDKDKAAAVYTHLVNTMKARPALRPLLVDVGRNDLDSPAAWIKHPSGRVIQVCVAAGKAAGNSVVSYFLAGVIFDEWGKMHGSGDGVVNFTDARHNSLGRLLNGAQLFGLGSLWAPYGPAYDSIENDWGNPTEQVCVFRAKGRDVNPYWWTAERIAKTPPNVLRTEESCEFLDAESDMFKATELDLCATAPESTPRQHGWSYAAVMDPATRGNGWPLIVYTRDQRGRVVVVFAKEWIGTSAAPTNIRATLTEITSILASYGIDSVTTDQWSSDAIREIAEELGLVVIQKTIGGPDKVEGYTELETWVREKLIALPPDRTLRQDLLRVKKRPLAVGFSMVEPKTKDGRHCDYASALARIPLLYLATDAAQADPPSAQEALRAELDAMQARRIERSEEQASREWWEQ